MSDENDRLEALLYNTTYEAIISICELLDGYTNDDQTENLMKTILQRTGHQ